MPDHPDSTAAAPWHVIATRGCGSALIEAALVLARVPYEREEIDYAQPGPARDRLLALNPLGQVPTVVLPGGAVMTESAALVLYLDELAPAASLLPRGEARAHALRWLVFLVAAIYPTFTYGDDPGKWVGDAGPRLREATDAHRARLWKQVERAAGSPWFLGASRSILDVYVGVMTRWRPRRAWFAEHCPKLHAIARAIDEASELRALWAAEFA